uniref:(northern house mosquito) hypothetical protein n=1 Tax=Culex pipiens TaxID=7175 RepID=A0A8D8MWF3_CULPI
MVGRSYLSCFFFANKSVITALRCIVSIFAISSIDFPLRVVQNRVASRCPRSSPLLAVVWPHHESVLLRSRILQLSSKCVGRTTPHSVLPFANPTVPFELRNKSTNLTNPFPVTAYRPVPV